MTTSVNSRGGSVFWKVTGGNAQVVDGDGEPVDEGVEVFCLCFDPNSINGDLPEKIITITVSYRKDDGEDL